MTYPHPDKGPSTLPDPGVIADDLAMSALLARLATALEGLAARTAQMQEDLSEFLLRAENPSCAQMREIQGLDLIQQTLDDLRTVASLAAHAACGCPRVDTTEMAVGLRLESCRIALLAGGEASFLQQKTSGEVDLF